MKSRFSLFLCLTFTLLAYAQDRPAKAPQAQAPAAPSSDISGMYTFLEEGEFIQLTVEDKQRVTGFVSRYGDVASDKGSFLDHFIKKGSLAGDQLSFATETVHGVSYEFKGKVERGSGKAPGEEAYYVLKGTLTQTTTDAQHQTKTSTREVEFKSFPKEDLPSSSPAKRD